MKRTTLVFFLSVLMLLVAAPAQAHPLGNFTINTFSSIEVSRDDVSLHYVIDMAEIPTFQLKQDFGLEGSALGDAPEIASDVARTIVAGIRLETNGTPVELTVESAVGRFVAGQGGLETLRIDAYLRGPLGDDTTTLTFADGNCEGRVGWREVVINAVDGQGISTSDAPRDSISNELRDYPQDLLASPLRVLSSAATIGPDAASQELAQGGGDQGAADQGEDPTGFEGVFASLVGKDLSVGVVLAALLLAILFGAVHALGPGHGKTVMAAYLVGAGGRPRQAVIVGIAVSLMHTTSVLVLGLITLWASDIFAPEAVYPWLSLASGVLVLGLGTWLFRARLLGHLASKKPYFARLSIHGLEGSPRTDAGAIAHARAHAAGLDHSHGELPSGVSLLSKKGLGAIAISGGLLPSPSALVVFLGAVALNRVAFGLILVAAFSVGLAGALMVVGLLVLKARDVAQRRMSRNVGPALQIASAAAIFGVGLVLTARAIFELPI